MEPNNRLRRTRRVSIAGTCASRLISPGFIHPYTMLLSIFDHEIHFLPGLLQIMSAIVMVQVPPFP